MMNQKAPIEEQIKGMKPTLLVLAAGMGSRYGGLKQIEPVGPGGATIIDYSIFDAVRTGFGKVVFVIRHDIETEFKSTFGQKFESKIPVKYAYQELNMLPSGFSVPPNRKKPWGTAHAVLAVKDLINEPFAVINADDFYGASAFHVLANFLQKTQNFDGDEYAMVGFVLRNTLSEFGSVSRGICQSDAKDYLQNIVELTKIEKAGDQAKYTDEAGNTHTLSGDEIVSMNIWGFTPSIFNHFQRLFIEFLQQHGQEEKSEFFIPTEVNTLIAQNQVRVKILASQDSWFGVTYQKDKAQVIKGIQHLIARGKYPKQLWP